MDETTVRSYDAAAKAFADRYDSVPSPFAKYFRVAFPEGARVLDLGSGSGRDMATMLGDGFEAYGVEPADALRRVALERRPELAGRLFGGCLPSAPPSREELCGGVDGITCCAVLQHVPRANLFDAVFAMRGMLRDHGRALVSIPETGPAVDLDHRTEDGRLFTGVTPDELQLLFERIGFQTIGRWANDDVLGRSNHRWVTILFELRSAVARPLDLVEGVLSRRERKVATYKLALLRALCDIAMTQAHVVRWREDGNVAVPIGRIAERWVLYYWPLFAADGLIPQMNGEWKAQSHKLAFAREMRSLLGMFAKSGGLTAYTVQARQQQLGEAEKKAQRALLEKLARVIKEGPVTYAGGSLASGRLFAYERKQVLVSPSLWRELSLTGHWVRDALLLRWAQLSSELSQGNVRPEEVIGLLLQQPERDRETEDARALYDELDDLRCVWTETELRAPRYHADHVIPYSLWQNNDLWNLLPVASEVNRQKSDKIPARELLVSRRPHVLHYWNEAKLAFPKRFDAEAAAQTGQRGVALTTLFGNLMESAEVTALQRGCDRWAPS